MKKIIILLLLSFVVYSQDKDPYELLDRVKTKYDKIEDYEVDVTIKIDVNFLKMPDSKAKIFFKKPDKVRLKSEGFAMLPKNGVNFSPAALLNGDYDALYIGSEEKEGRLYEVVKVIPKSDSSGVILTTLKIDPQNDVVSFVETTTKNTGSFEVEVKYTEIEEYHLPQEVILSFNMGDIQIPKAAAAQFDRGDDKLDDTNKKDKDKMKGTVKIFYENYKVNVGLSDDIFTDEKK